MDRAAQAYGFLQPAEPISRGNATAHVTELLRRAIVTLQMPPGMDIDKPQLCERLGVSRFPVSEALARLQIEGLVDILPQRGSRVALIRIAEVREYMLIRSALEAEAVLRLAPGASSELIDGLKTTIEGQKQAIGTGDLDRFHDLDLVFHEHLFSAMRFARVQAIIDTARANVDRARRLLNSPRRVQHTINEHEAILKAIAAHDPEAAAAAMRAHLDAVMADLFRFASAQPHLFADGQTELAVGP